MNRVAFHFAVAESPRIAALRIEPNYPPSALRDFPQRPVMRQIVVISRVAENDNCCPLINSADMVGRKITKRPSEIRMRVHINDITLERYVQRMFDIMHAEMLGHF